jgi:Cu+-exporting ATPase
MSQDLEFKHFTIAHQNQGRLRIVAPSLYGDKERATILRIILLKTDSIEDVNIVSEINSVTIHFDPEKFPEKKLLNLLEIVLDNFSQKPYEGKKTIVESVVHRYEPKQDFVFSISGMSCASCAMFLEMVLSRESKISHASIDYVTETGKVRGYLSKAEIFKIVEDNGYRAKCN